MVVHNVGRSIVCLHMDREKAVNTQPAATTLTILDGGGGSVLQVLELDHHPMSILHSA